MEFKFDGMGSYIREYFIPKEKHAVFDVLPVYFKLPPGRKREVLLVLEGWIKKEYDNLDKKYGREQ